MEPIKIAFAGAGGYADYCLDLLLTYIPPQEYELVGIADPFACRAPRYEFFKSKNIALYDTVEELFADRKVDALYIASPIPFHKRQCEAALAHGCAVLCEKPLTARYRDTMDLRNRAARSKQPFGVGFQWSFAPSVLRAKQDILSGVYGKAVALKALISWQRFDDYYNDSRWKGRITDADGNPVYDSVATNATAHYLHNIFFMMGSGLSQSELPAQAWGSVYRAKPIESFDTCFLKGKFSDGADFLFLSTHSGDETIQPIVEYTFEKGVIRIDTNTAAKDENPSVRGYIDGKEIVYGEVSTPAIDSHKVKAFLASVRDGTPLPCPIDAVLPQQAVCAAMFDQLAIHQFPNDRVYRTANPGGYFVNGLCGDLTACFERVLTPWEAGCIWAKEDCALELSGYHAPALP